jgi:hypothetical protein
MKRVGLFARIGATLGIRREVAEKYVYHISSLHSGVNGVHDRYDYCLEMVLANRAQEIFLQSMLGW